MNEQEQPRRRRRRLYRTSADWFGLAAVALLMICSLVLLVLLALVPPTLYAMTLAMDRLRSTAVELIQKIRQ